MDYATMQSILGWAAIAAALVAGGIVGVMLVYDLGKPLWRRLARLWRRSPVECVAALALLCYCVAWGGGKITFPRTNAEYELLKDAGSYATNDTLHVAYTAHALLPDAADLQVYRRPAASTNDADWAEAWASTVGASPSPFDLDFEAATNYNWVVFTTWQPAPAVQTNGVIYANWLLADGAATNADELAATPIKTQAVLARDAADIAAEMTEPEAYAAFAPDTAILIDLSLANTNVLEVGISNPRSLEATIDWGDGTISEVTSMKNYYAIYKVSHAYAKQGRYVVRVSDTVGNPFHNSVGITVRAASLVRILRLGDHCSVNRDGFANGYYVQCPSLRAFPEGTLARWPTNATQIGSFYRNCPNLDATILPEWPEGVTKILNTYAWNTKITATVIPEWPKSLKNLCGPYSGCTGMRPSRIPDWPDGLVTINEQEGCTTYRGVRFTPEARIPAWPTNAAFASANYTYYGCTSLTGTIPAWPTNAAFASANYTYRNCTSLTGTIPAWPTNAAFASANYTYQNCTSLTGTIPAWPTNAAFASANYTYYGCTSLTGAWTTVAAELMPTNITSHSYTVGWASEALRKLFYSSWGGTRKEGE